MSQVVEARSIASEVGVSSAQRQHQSELDALRFFAYGLYVFHKLCQFTIPHLGLRGAVLNTVASLVATMACAALSYRFLKKPFLLKERLA
jgi:peptidoglycan/LPS O-acetylase OafA/YrhL